MKLHKMENTSQALCFRGYYLTGYPNDGQCMAGAIKELNWIIHYAGI